ncbi:MAG: DUF502 domain-containing protein [Proteobacteria bacterium]|nr:DUF502 domain-containing protein [Pseudomonadota bacterium]
MTQDQKKQDSGGQAGSADVSSRGVFARLRAYLLAGILVTAPIAITVYLTYGFLLWVDSKVTPLIPPHYNPNSYLPFSMPGLGLIIAVVFFIMVGWFAKNFLGRMIIGVSENIVHRLPVIRAIYKALKQIFETVMTSQSQAFRDVVMFEYPRKGSWALGFVTGVTKGEVQRLTDTEVVNVFLPTTPNPTSGYLLFLPRKDLVFMKMSVEEGIKMIVSGGIITPPDPEDARNK